MIELILIMILTATIAYVTAPYWQRRTTRRLDTDNGHLTDLVEQRDNLLSTIKEIEFDCQTGKVSESDFTEMNSHYRAEAITVLRRIDALRHNSRGSKKLEAELDKIRAKQQDKGTQFCSDCGQSVCKGDRFCANCGYRMQD